MSSTAGSIWFRGDWSDPWLEGVARALPREPVLRRIDTSAPWPIEEIPPRWLILHQPRLLPGDAERFASWKKDSRWRVFPASILCYGPFARYAELERWLPLVDVALPEATAADTLPRRVERGLELGDGEISPARDESSRVLVVSTNSDLRRTLADACAEWVAQVFAIPDMRSEPRSGTGSGGFISVPGSPTVTILDVPLLEVGWEGLIASASRLGPVIALLGFSNRSTVQAARSLGAWVCLELPFDRDDLGFAVCRCVAEARAATKDSALTGFEPGHRVPPPPTKPRVASPGRPLRRGS